VTGIVQQALAAPTSPLGGGVLEDARLGVDILGSAEEQVLLPHTCRLDVFKRKVGVILEAFRDIVLFMAPINKCSPPPQPPCPSVRSGWHSDAATALPELNASHARQASARV
jgi:hypothetical protein